MVISLVMIFRWIDPAGPAFRALKLGDVILGIAGNRVYAWSVGRLWRDQPDGTDFDDNGKSDSAAIFFDLMGNREGAEFFSDMLLASSVSGREAGHCGCF